MKDNILATYTLSLRRIKLSLPIEVRITALADIDSLAPGESVVVQAELISSGIAGDLSVFVVP